MNYDESLEWLYSTQMFGIKLGLDGPAQLLREFLAFPARGTQVIQVAGTNGKGSVCVISDSLARACGWRTGLFTSPHLVHYRERMRVSGEMISEHECARYLTELRKICEGMETHPTFFEITLACAMRWFRDKECELIILEVGMGGRLDATTAVPSDIALITPVGLDHTRWLGTTHAEIAAEKAGIIREGKPVFSSLQNPEAEKVIRQEANEKRAEVRFITEPVMTYTLGLKGEHQRENAALALAGLHELGAPLSFDAVSEGLRAAMHAGRFEEVRPNLVVDAAHNTHAAESLVKTWRAVYGDVKATLIFGAVEDKDIAGVAMLLAEIVEKVYLVEVNSERALSPAVMLDSFPAAEVCASLKEALVKTRDELTLLTGSLFLVGQAKAFFEEQEHRSTTQ